MAEDPRLQLPDGAVRLTCETPRGELAVTCIGMDNTPHRRFLFVPGNLASKEDFYALMSVLADAG